VRLFQLEMHQKRLVAEAPPGLAGELTALPQTP